MFLDLGLQVGGILEGLFGGGGELFVNPCLQLIRVPFEVLKPTGIFKLLTPEGG